VIYVLSNGTTGTAHKFTVRDGIIRSYRTVGVS